MNKRTLRDVCGFVLLCLAPCITAAPEIQATLVKDIEPGSGFSSMPEAFTIQRGHYVDIVRMGDAIYFPAASGGQVDLWKSDGTEEGTQRVYDLPDEDTNTGVYGLSVDGDRLFFANDADVYVTDGTASGTTLLETLPGRVMEMVVAGGKAFYTTDYFLQQELYAHDGTPGGATYININQVPTGSFPPEQSSFPRMLTVWDDRIIFGATDGLTDFSPWVSDGTVTGTLLLADVGSPSDFVATPAGAYFKSTVMTYKTDGTASGTMQVNGDGLETIYSYLQEGSISPAPVPIPPLVASDGRLYGPYNDGVHGEELGAFDTATNQLSLVSDVTPGASAGWIINSLRELDGEIYFNYIRSSLESELWKTDGTASGTQMIESFSFGSVTNPQSTSPFLMTTHDSHVVFALRDPDNMAYLAGVSDGSASGTVVSESIWIGREESDMPHLSPLVELNGKLLGFAQVDSEIGFELYALGITEEAGPLPVVWVDFDWSGSETGAQATPFNTLAEGVEGVEAGGMVKIFTGASSETPRLTKAMSIEAIGGPVRLGDPGDPEPAPQALPRGADPSATPAAESGRSSSIHWSLFE